MLIGFFIINQPFWVHGYGTSHILATHRTFEEGIDLLTHGVGPESRTGLTPGDLEVAFSLRGNPRGGK